MVIIKYKDGSVFKNLDPTLITPPRWSTGIDKYGSFEFEYPLTDVLSDKLVDAVELQIYEDTVFIYGGFISSISDVIIGEELMKSVQGRGYMSEFVREGYTVPNIGYHNELITDILDPSYGQTLIDPNTWDTIVESTSQDFTYLTSLQTAMGTYQIVNRQSGFHFRYIGDAANVRKVEFGTLGVDSGVRLRQEPKNHYEFGTDLLVADDVVMSVDYDAVINWLYVLGGGNDNGVNQLTMRDVEAGVIDPTYPILIDAVAANNDVTYDPAIFGNEKTGPNTAAAYYLKDQTSIDTYGLSKKSVVFKDIFPITSDGDTITDQDRKNAANEVYRAAKQKLIDSKDPHVTYRLSAIGETTNFKPGDTINFKFKGEVTKIINGTKTQRVYIDVDEDFYVVEIRATYTNEAMRSNVKRYDLAISNLPKEERTSEKVIQDLVTTVSDYTRQRKGSVTTGMTPYKDSFDSSYPAKFFYWIPPEMVYTDYIKLKIKIRPFRAYSKATQGGGATTKTTTAITNHTHIVSIPNHTHLTSFNVVAGVGTGTLQYNQSGSMVGFGGSGASGIVGATSTGSGGATVPTSAANGGHSHSVTLPNHTHTITFGVFENGTPASSIKLYIDGVDYSASSEIPVINAFGSFPSTLNATYDLLKAASEIGELDNLLTGGIHEVEVRCSSGLSLVELFFFNQFYLSSK